MGQGSHWKVDNQLHAVLDVFEDACMKRVENEAENFACLWRVVLKNNQKFEERMNNISMKRKRRALTMEH